MAADPSGSNWLVTGSSRGHLTLWDMRFNLAVNSIQQPQVCSRYTFSHLASVAAPCQAVSSMHYSWKPIWRGEPEQMLYLAEHRQGWCAWLQNYPVEALAPALASPARLGLQESSIATPLVYVASGPQEIGLWDIEQGKCHQVIQ